MGLWLAPATGDQGAPLFCVADQLEPSKWRRAPSRPAAQTSVFEVPAIARSALCVPDGTSDQAEPFQCSRVPASPATQTSVADAPHTAENVTCFGSSAIRHQWWSSLHDALLAVTGGGSGLAGAAGAAAATGACAGLLEAQALSGRASASTTFAPT